MVSLFAASGPTVYRTSFGNTKAIATGKGEPFSALPHPAVPAVPHVPARLCTRLGALEPPKVGSEHRCTRRPRFRRASCRTESWRQRRGGSRDDSPRDRRPATAAWVGGRWLRSRERLGSDCERRTKRETNAISAVDVWA